MIIGRLTGAIVAELGAGAVIVDVGGVGYEVTVPLGTGGRATSAGASVTLHIHTHVTDKSIALYGFATPEDKAIFRLLIGVHNLGPKTAIALLGELPAAELTRAVRDSDVARLSRVPGIGKKTADRLVLELRGKLPELAGAARAPSGPAPGPGDAAGRVLSALTNMGYRPAEAERAVAALGDGLDEQPIDELLRKALAALAP